MILSNSYTKRFVRKHWMETEEGVKVALEGYGDDSGSGGGMRG